MSEEMGLVLSKLNEMNAKIDSMNAAISNMDVRLTNVEAAVARNTLIMENDISRKIDAIGDGHDFLKAKLDKALMMETKRERMELDIVNLKMDVRKIKQHVSLA